MALKHTITAVNNFGTQTTLPDCYCKVTRVVGDKEKIYSEVSYFSPAKDRVYFTRTFEFEPEVGDSAKDFIAQTYVYIKGLPEFSGARDV